MNHDIGYAPGAGCWIHYGTCPCGQGSYQMGTRRPRHRRVGGELGVAVAAVAVVTVSGAAWCALMLWLSSAAV